MAEHLFQTVMPLRRRILQGFQGNIGMGLVTCRRLLTLAINGQRKSSFCHECKYCFYAVRIGLLLSYKVEAVLCRRIKCAKAPGLKRAYVQRWPPICTAGSNP